MSDNKKRVLKFTLLLAFIIIAIFLIKYYDLANLLNPSDLRAWISSYGSLAPLIFILIYIIATVIFLPASPISIASGLIFGRYLGTLYILIGATIGATFAFLISRYLGSQFIQEKIERKYKKIHEYDKKLEKNGFLAVLFLRLVPLFPFNGLNFALGLTRVKLKDFIFGTALGIIPGSFALAYFGDSLAMLSIINIIAATILFILLALVPTIYKKLKSKRSKRENGK